MSERRRRPRKSLRTLLMMWLILFSVVPLAFITGYSLVKYEQAIDQELAERLRANFRELQIILSEFETELVERSRRHSTDRMLTYYMTTANIPQARELVTLWMSDSFASQISVFSRDGRLEVALFRGEGGRVERYKKMEGSDVYLSKAFLEKAKTERGSAHTDFSASGTLDLIAFSPIANAKGQVVGFIEEVVKIDRSFLSGLKNRTGLEIVFFDKAGESIVSSQEDFSQYRKRFFLDQFTKLNEQLFDLIVREVPYGFSVQPISWGKDDFYLALGASKKSSREVLKNVNLAFFSVVGTIAVLLVVLSFLISKIMLRPLNELVSSIENLDPEKSATEIRVSSDTELGLLTESFNDLSRRVYRGQFELKENIKKLEAANRENLETQAKLVHAAKMAGLGQLVAGIAHELNNPISFIYSNMAHLREYAEKLVTIISKADRKIDLTQEKSEAEYDYIVRDLPKLISSCEDGARRTRDIVIGLRNFSRLEEAVIKEVDLHEGIDATLALLQGEFKSRIKVVKEYGHIPKILCYPSQLNQVFMNILANAAHAIEGDGQIVITTKKAEDARVLITIADTGRGMDKETAQKIFDPFFTTKGVSQGTGLGLSISYGIIQKHGGEIQVQSEPGRGTVFTILLPVRNLTKV